MYYLLYSTNSSSDMHGSTHLKTNWSWRDNQKGENRQVVLIYKESRFVYMSNSHDSIANIGVNGFLTKQNVLCTILL